MSFNTGLSGLNAANADMGVIGNNIANVGTTGFKTSRAEFADLYLSSKIGGGVYLAGVQQNMGGGNISSTGRSLDLAIEGQGYFVLNNNGETFYGRAGAFYTDKNGQIIDSSGSVLQGYAVDANNNIKYGTLANLELPSTSINAKATSKISFAVSLDTKAKSINAEEFNPEDASTFNWSTNNNIYDSQGNVHNLVNYFVKDANNNWTMYTLIDGRNPNDATSNVPAQNHLTFNEQGELIEGNKIDLGNWQPATEQNGWHHNGTAINNLTLDLSGSLQINTDFALNSAGIKQDGYGSGLMTGLNISEDGKMFANFSNGQSKIIGQLALATFANEQGLEAVSGNKWRATYDAGNPVVGVPKSGLAGKIKAEALEDSNVDLTAQLVQMIVAQRNYQANAKTIETESTLAQTIINLR